MTYPLNIVEIQGLDADGKVILRLPDPIYVHEDGSASVNIKIPEGFDVGRIVRWKEILEE